MTASAQSITEPRRNSGLSGVLIVLAIIGFAGVLFYFADFSRSLSLNRSAIGFEGLTIWLDDNDVDASMFYGNDVLERGTVGLRVLPLYDIDLSTTEPRPQTDEDRTFQETHRDIAPSVLTAKIQSLPSLVILPKWRTGIVETGVARPQFLISVNALDQLLRRQLGEAGAISRSIGESSSVATTDGATIVLHYPQFVEAGDCDPIIGDEMQMLLGLCKNSDNPYWLLADPDLLNNHGLTQADNAAVALALLASLAGEGSIIVDATTQVWTAETVDTEERSWADLARFFAYPFSIIWVSLLVLMLLVLWRAWRRFGPIDNASYEEAAPKASRDVSIGVKARMLRLTGNDAAIVRAHVGNRLQTLAAEILGPHRARGSAGLDALHRAAARRFPSLSRDLKQIAEDIVISEKSTPAEMLSYVDHVDDLIKRTRNEFGRSESGG